MAPKEPRASAAAEQAAREARDAEARKLWDKKRHSRSAGSPGTGSYAERSLSSSESFLKRTGRSK